MSLGLGDINAAVLQGLVTSLGGMMDKVGPEEAAVLTTAMDHFNAIGTALESKTMADFVTTVEDPILTELQAWRAELKPVSDLAGSINSLVSLVVGAVTPKQP